MIGDPMMSPVQRLLIAAGVAAVGFGSRRADANHLASATAGVRWMALVVPLLLLAQLSPLPLSWSHPIWTSAAEAFPGTSLGHVTIDIGRTVQALVATTAWLTAVLLGIVVARDRRRAELALLAASAVVTFLSLAAIIQHLSLAGSNWTMLREVAVCFGQLGILLNTAVIFLAVERRETRRRDAAHYLPIGLCGAAAVVINATALYGIAAVPQWIAVGLGLAIVLLLLVIRRFALSRWTVGALGAAMAAGVAILAAWLFDRNAAASGLLRFIAPPASDTMITLQRLIADSRWFGSGTNTFDVLGRIYQNDATIEALRAPTSAIALAVETGWVGLLIFLCCSLALFVRLCRGALERGRDWFFPAVTAAGVALCLCSSFVTQGFFNPPVALTLAVLVGIGLAQSYSQTASH